MELPETGTVPEEEDERVAEKGSRSSMEGYFDVAATGDGFIHCPNISFMFPAPPAPPAPELLIVAGTVIDRVGAPGMENADS